MTFPDEVLRPMAAALTRSIARVASGLFARGTRAWHGAGVLAELAAAVITLMVSCQPQYHPAGAPHDAPAAPPGRVVTDDGRAFAGAGSSRFTVRIDPANDAVRLIRRLDAGIAMQTASITVNGSRAGVWPALSGESTYRWRDQRIDIPPRLTAGRGSITITNRFVSSTQDFNEFTYLVDQRVNGVWSRTAVVDVGPGHPADEAAHRYRITGQTWVGVRTFRYLR